MVIILTSPLCLGHSNVRSLSQEVSLQTQTERVGSLSIILRLHLIDDDCPRSYGISVWNEIMVNTIDVYNSVYC